MTEKRPLGEGFALLGRVELTIPATVSNHRPCQLAEPLALQLKRPIVFSSCCFLFPGKLWSRSLKLAYTLLNKLGTKNEPVLKPGDRVICFSLVLFGELMSVCVWVCCLRGCLYHKHEWLLRLSEEGTRLP